MEGLEKRSENRDPLANSRSPSSRRWRRFLLDRAKLKATSRTSALLSGFAMVAMVELQLNNSPTEDDKVWYAIFAAVTTLLIATHTLSLLISTCILPSLETVNPPSRLTSGVNNRWKILKKPSGLSLSALDEIPYESLRFFVEIAWIFSTGIGILLFLVEVGLLCWIKFVRLSPIASYVGVAVVIPLLILLVAFAFKFYKRMVDERLEEESAAVNSLLRLKEKIDEAERNVGGNGIEVEREARTKDASSIEIERNRTLSVASEEIGRDFFDVV